MTRKDKIWLAVVGTLFVAMLLVGTCYAATPCEVVIDCETVGEACCPQIEDNVCPEPEPLVCPEIDCPDPPPCPEPEEPGCGEVTIRPAKGQSMILVPTRPYRFDVTAAVGKDSAILGGTWNWRYFQRVRPFVAASWRDWDSGACTWQKCAWRPVERPDEWVGMVGVTVGVGSLVK